MVPIAEQQILVSSDLKSSLARNKILRLIQTGQLSPGQKIPSERELANSLKVTQGTVRRGLVELVSQGLVVNRPRVGNFVKDVRTAIRVGVVLPKYMLEGKPQHPAAALYVGGASRIFNSRDYLFCNFSYRPGQLWADVGEVAIGSGVKGILVAPEFDTSAQEIERFLNAGIKVVLLSYHKCAVEVGVPSVAIDYGMAINQIMKRLIELGHRRILVVKEANSAARQIEEEIIADICRRENLGLLSEMVLNVPNDNNVLDYGSLQKVFERNVLPTAVITSDEFLASELFRLCFARKLRVPEDISIASRWDSMPAMHPVPLTAPDGSSLCRSVAEVGAKMLTKLLAGEDLLESAVKLRCDVQWRKSTGPVPKN